MSQSGDKTSVLLSYSITVVWQPSAAARWRQSSATAAVLIKFGVAKAALIEPWMHGARRDDMRYCVLIWLHRSG